MVLPDWHKVLSYLEEKSPAVLGATALVMLFVIFMPLVLSEDKSVGSDFLKLRKDYFPYIAFLFLVSSIFSVTGLISRKQQKRKDEERKRKEDEQRREEENELAQKKALEYERTESLLKKLIELEKSMDEASEDRDKFIAWANKVAPLLRFNEMYYAIFMNNFQVIPMKLSGLALGPAVDRMKSQVSMAVEELKNDLETDHPTT